MLGNNRCPVGRSIDITPVEERKIVATGLTEWVINRQHQYAHTYTVVTNAKSYLLECGHKPLFGTTGEECGGAKKLQIGDVVHFRIEKDRVYIPITKVDNSAAEEKLRILSTELRSGAAAEKPCPRRRTPVRPRKETKTRVCPAIPRELKHQVWNQRLVEQAIAQVYASPGCRVASLNPTEVSWTKGGMINSDRPVVFCQLLQAVGGRLSYIDRHMVVPVEVTGRLDMG